MKYAQDDFMGKTEETLAKLNPKIAEGTFWICTISKDGKIPENVIATFKEDRGTTVVLKQDEKPEFECTTAKAMISVGIDTPSGAEGFLAKIATAIAEDNTCVYVFSAYYQNHLFVPKEKAEEVIEVLKELKSKYQ